LSTLFLSYFSGTFLKWMPSYFLLLIFLARAIYSLVLYFSHFPWPWIIHD
jgi:hypothetical protein